MSRSLTSLQGGALLGLALLIFNPAFGDETLREQVHRTHKHRSYMLIEDAAGARLYFFDTGPARVEYLDLLNEPFTTAAIQMTRSDDARTRVRGLTQLAGAQSDEALDIALQLLTDPSPAVREEAQNLILDHPRGADMVAALGLVDEDLED